jgi:hypothetical protein
VGGELMDRIVSQSHFSEKVASRFFQQMLAGVQHCHNNLVVHRYWAVLCLCCYRSPTHSRTTSYVPGWL